MPHNFSFVFPLPNGLHARPASLLAAVAAPFAAAISLHSESSGNHADAHSVLALISADIRLGDECVLRVEGPDEDLAIEALVHFLSHELPHCDAPLPSAPETRVAGTLPGVLEALGVQRWWAGQPVCPGLALAPLVAMGGLTLAEGFVWPAAESPDNEQRKLVAALDAAHTGLQHEIRATSGQATEILSAQASMLCDRALAAQLREHLLAHGGTGGEAVLAVTAALSARLRVGSAYLQERVADLQDVAARILTHLYGVTALRRAPVLTAPTILSAPELTAGQFLALERRHLCGVVLENGGATSHTAILARAAGLPLLIGVKGAATLPVGAVAILDARRGILLVEPTPEVRRFYQREADRSAAAVIANSSWRDRPALSADGVALPLYANVASASEVDTAVERGAEGIGLFRTELLFMNRTAAPDEDEQLAIYREAVRHAAGRPLIIRTLDIGGDKPLAYLDLPVEPNPFLGLRGVRLYPQIPALIRNQVRALLRASAHGPLKIMVPMIACAREMATFRTLVEATRQELLAEGHQVGTQLAIGAMLEIPSAVFAVPEIARHADFFSVGSNDLAQYFLAADRDNPATVELGTWKHPAFLRLLQMAVKSAHAAGRPIGLCGDLASQPEALPLLLAMGFNSISLGAAGIAAAKIALARLTRAAARGRCDEVLAAADHTVVEAVLTLPVGADTEPRFLVRELLQPCSSASSKAEVINELVALVEAAGRTRNAVALEEAVWIREAVYATNFGHGFAVPHCQTPHVSRPVIALLRLREPVQWTESEDHLVRIALLLAMPAGENRAHLQIFARLARLIMRDEFRSALETAPDADALLAVLAAALEPAS